MCKYAPSGLELFHMRIRVFVRVSARFSTSSASVVKPTRLQLRSMHGTRVIMCSYNVRRVRRTRRASMRQVDITSRVSTHVGDDDVRNTRRACRTMGRTPKMDFRRFFIIVGYSYFYARTCGDGRKEKKINNTRT